MNKLNVFPLETFVKQHTISKEREGKKEKQLKGKKRARRHKEKGRENKNVKKDGRLFT